MKPSRLEPKPTAKQLRYLKALAASTGSSFTYPKTAREASRAIDELKKRRDAAPTQERNWQTLSARRDREHIARDTQERPRAATRIREDEISGWGSSASYTDPWADELTED